MWQKFYLLFDQNVCQMFNLMIYIKLIVKMLQSFQEDNGHLKEWTERRATVPL